MMLMTTFTLFTFIMLMILMKIIPVINLHKMTDREKNSPFECGFDPFYNSRISFSIHFFSICLMFLIFDIEITLILPIPMMKLNMKMTNWMLFSLFMIIILIMGLFMEWKEGSMEWK